MNWREIFIKSSSLDSYDKFRPLPLPIPWSRSCDENISTSVEWLVRAGRTDSIKYAKESVVNGVRDGWYQIEFEEGKFLHVCYPKDLLKFRGQYDGLYAQLKELNYLTMGSEEVKVQAEITKQKLWSAWKTIGFDGALEADGGVFPLTDNGAMIPACTDTRRWNNQCSRCCAPLPKSLRMWVALQHSKLADV